MHKSTTVYYRDVFWQGNCDDGCLALAELLGWKVCVQIFCKNYLPFCFTWLRNLYVNPFKFQIQMQVGNTKYLNIEQRHVEG